VTDWLLLHGTPLTPAVWDGVIELLTGCGEVAAPAVVPGSGPAAVVQRSLAQGLATGDGIGVPPPWNVVGHSFGGQVAVEMALQRPEVVASLTLLCTRDTPYPPFAAAAADVTGGVVDVEGSLQRWFSPAELAADGSVVRYARDTLLTADRVVWARALSAISVFDASAAVHAITCPVTLVAAGHDRVSDPPAMADMAARLTDGELRVLDDAWHMSVFTDPVGLAQLIYAARG
jgi:3-oxoadipate enol-lactonase